MTPGNMKRYSKEGKPYKYKPTIYVDEYGEIIFNHKKGENIYQTVKREKTYVEQSRHIDVYTTVQMKCVGIQKKLEL